MATAPTSRSTGRPILIGFASGVLVAVPAIMAAIMSAGAGHGDYVAARWLFPAPCLLTLLENDSFGMFSIGLGLLQFPIYGAVLGWSGARKNYLPAIVMTLAHITAALFCFAGTLPNFS